MRLRNVSEAEVIVIGAGPAGMATAIALGKAGVESIKVIEREREPGGIPRHAQHTGFGARDCHRVLNGPRYSQRYVDLLERSGAVLETETTVTGIDADRRLSVTGPGGRYHPTPRAVVLASGCRERPRSARLIAGSRPAGVMTTSTLQQLVYLRNRSTPGKALIVGAEHVSFSAISTLAHGGGSAIALITEQPRHQSFAAFRLGAAVRYRTPVLTGTRLVSIAGKRIVESVELEDLRSGKRRSMACDMVIFTGDWIPEFELAAMAGCQFDPGTRGPRVDASLRTSEPGVFCAGNILHGAEVADVAALDGYHVADSVKNYLSGFGSWPEQVEIEVRAPLEWIAPNLVAVDGRRPPRDRFLLRSKRYLRRPQIEVAQAGSAIYRKHLTRMVPNRSSNLPAAWIQRVRPGAGPVSVGIVDME